ncbi:RISC-loading complex subunit tarbp2 [Eurytemora carolleeae]|uniref:RISC-loading complex subunit tarbp2 n=1 Tax=Eurytemora carolleeae TaxID=1294199 RepID=UPI000C75881D|nr:RISC-loading complex subunit tarbp2 [Eurytemora carolleeae]|eukprot:XP_023323842.1 RISC-loading complex subunit tarbp2-like [Eurytemora affinis]
MAGLDFNYVGLVQEKCTKKGLPNPVYTDGAVSGLDHSKQFVISCKLGTILESGEGSTKKEAKRNAAKKVYEKLEEGDVAIFSTEISTLSIDAKDIIEKVSSFTGLTVEVMTVEAAEKVASFYRSLRNASGPKISELQSKPDSTSSDKEFWKILSEVAAEQNFKVDYTEIEEGSDEDEAQCMIRVGDLPATITFGLGKDKEMARNEAARAALQYMRILVSQLS